MMLKRVITSALEGELRWAWTGAKQWEERECVDCRGIVTSRRTTGWGSVCVHARDEEAHQDNDERGGLLLLLRLS